MNLTKEKRWLAEDLYEVTEVDVLIQEDGTILMYSYDGEEYLNPSEEDFFSESKEEAEAHRKLIKPDNIKQIRRYIELLFMHSKFDELEEVLPNGVYKNFLKGYGAQHCISFKEWRQIESAIAGIINIGGYSFRADQILKVRHIGGKENRLTVILTDGTEIHTEAFDSTIIKAIVGENFSNVHFKK